MSSMSGHYDEAVICENGHLVNESAKGDSSRNAKFCVHCGARIVTTCPACEAPIRGRYIGTYYVGDGMDAKQVIQGSPMRHLPRFCHECGEAYPWTKANSEALAALISTLDELTPSEREQLQKSIPDIIADTTKSGVAATWFKKAVTKVGQEARKLMVDVLSKVATDAVKGQMEI